MLDDCGPTWTDPATLGGLYDRHYASVLRYCVHRLYVRAVTEDVTSEVFLEVVKRIGSFAGREETDFANWLFAIATRRIHATVRKSRRRRELLAAAARDGRLHPAASAPEPGRGLAWAELYAAIATLSGRDQTLITLRSFEQLPFERIAVICGMKPTAARVAYGRALGRLRERLTCNDGRGS